MIVNSNCFSYSLLCGSSPVSDESIPSSNFLGAVRPAAQDDADASAGCLHDTWWSSCCCRWSLSSTKPSCIKAKMKVEGWHSGPIIVHPRCGRLDIRRSSSLWKRSRSGAPSEVWEKTNAALLLWSFQQDSKRLISGLHWIHWCNNWESLWAKRVFVAHGSPEVPQVAHLGSLI